MTGALPSFSSTSYNYLTPVPRYWLTGVYNWQCEPVDYSMSLSGLDAADITWWYFLSKFIDYLDSFFFVLRKKFSHLSTLHVVHHGIMPFTAWWGIR